jgi:hypothetical protein
MSRDLVRYQPPSSDRLHSVVWKAMAGLALWLVLAVWSFAGNGYTDYLLVVVSGFLFVAVALPYVLSRVGRKGQDRAAAPEESFYDWAAGEFDTWQGRLKGANAAVEILLPLAALALGMTAFGLVYLLAAHGAA